MIDGLPAVTRGLLALAVVVLHAIAWVAVDMPGLSHAEVVEQVPTRPPLQVMLLSEHVGQGKVLLAPEAPEAPAGTRAMPQPPPAEPMEPAERQAKTPQRPALPITAPNLDSLRRFGLPQAPIRLRVHIDAAGKVTQIDVVEAAAADAEFVERLVEILLGTAHIPARQDGRDVASVKNLVLDWSSPAAAEPP